jgi:ketosteroid isomerase-like protein
MSRLEIAKMYEKALFAGDRTAVGKLFHDDIVYWVAGTTRIGGEWRGRERALDALWPPERTAQVQAGLASVYVTGVTLLTSGPVPGSHLRPQPGKRMRRHIALFAVLALAVSVPAVLSAQDSSDVKRDRKEVRHDRRELRRDRRDVRHDTKDIRQDRRDVRQDLKNGDTTDARRDRRDLRQDRRDRRHHVRDARGDRRDLRHDRKDVHEDQKKDSTR